VPGRFTKGSSCLDSQWCPIDVHANHGTTRLGEASRIKGLHWKYFFAGDNVDAGTLGHIYDPHEYRVIALRDHATSNLFYFGQHSPAGSGRISKGINFPAIVLNYPFRDATQLLYEHVDVDHILIMICPADVGFWVGIVFFWPCFGWTIDWSGLPIPRNRVVRFGGLALGLIFGLATGGYAAKMIVSKWFPERIIGWFGIAWATVLIAHFVWRLAYETKPGRLPGSASPA
jgi:hypothetical protein